MSWRRFKLLCERGIQLVSILLLGAGASRATGKDGPNAEALVRSPVSIVLDGTLDEPVWRDAPVLKLVQQSPKPGEPTPYDTEVQVIVTGDRIYFGFDCKDPKMRLGERPTDEVTVIHATGRDYQWNRVIQSK
jgi:hypothetical protein